MHDNNFTYNSPIGRQADSLFEFLDARYLFETDHFDSFKQDFKAVKAEHLISVFSDIHRDSIYSINLLNIIAEDFPVNDISCQNLVSLQKIAFKMYKEVFEEPFYGQYEDCIFPLLMRVNQSLMNCLNTTVGEGTIKASKY